MRNSTLRKLLAFSAIAFLLLQSCKDDAYLTKQAPTPDQSFVEEFDTMQAAQSRGWLMRNRSEPIGRGLWTQGMTGLQASGTTVAYSSRSTNVGFISADYTMCHQAGPGGGDISSFVISPRIILQNGDRIIFYTRSCDTISRWGDRLQLVINKNNDGIECGRGLDPGDFNVTLVDINPLCASGFTLPAPTPPSPYAAAPPYPLIYDNVGGFPNNWTRYEGRVSGLPGATPGRFALRYFVPFGGDSGRGDHISIDSVAYVSVNHK